MKFFKVVIIFNNNNLNYINTITLTFSKCQEALSKLADRPMPMYESDTETQDLQSKFKSSCQLYNQMLQDIVISEIHKICDVQGLC